MKTLKTHTMKKLIFSFVIALITFSSCDNKTYKYSERVKKVDIDGKFVGYEMQNEKSIKAKSDSEAYRTAYMYFCVSTMTSESIEKENGVHLDKAIDFKLENDEGVNIRNSTKMNDRNKIEAEIEKSVHDEIYNSNRQ